MAVGSLKLATNSRETKETGVKTLSLEGQAEPLE